MAITAAARGLLSAAGRRFGTTASARTFVLPRSSSAAGSSSIDPRRWFSSYPPHEVVGMPSLSPTMESGTIAKWNLGPGSSFGPGDVLCEVETDKATVDFEAQDDGVIAKILAEAGPTEIKCGEPIVVVCEDEDDVAAFEDFVVEGGGGGGEEAPAPAAAAPAPAPAVEAAPAAPAPAPAAPAAPAAAPGGRVVASPLAHTVAKEMGLGDLSALSGLAGTGPGGRVIAADVREYVPPFEAAAAPVEAAAAVPAAAAVAAIPAAPPVPGVGYTDYPLSPSAMNIAAQLAQSKRDVPHYYLTVDLNLDSLLELRSSLNASLNLDENQPGISVNDLLIKAAACAMKAVPSANASWMGTAVRVYDSVDINVAVGNGSTLYSPVVRDCGGRGVKAISDDVQAAVAAVDEDGEGPTADFGEVGTFTVINVGMYGVKSCAPIVREPQAVALALGTIENRIVPEEDPDSEEIYKQSVMMTATLSCDHRVVDGAVGAQWLGAFKGHVESPATLLL